MLRRVLAIALALAVLPAGLSACQRKVSVQTGERIVCRYGDTIKDTVHTVEVPASEASLYTVKTSFGICERHERMLSLYMRAQDAIAANRLDSARSLLASVVAGDPKFEQAAPQLAAIKAGRKPTVDPTVKQQPTGNSTSGGSGSNGSTTGSGSSTGGTKPPAGGTPVGPTVTLAAWAPAALDGYHVGATSADALALSREYIPTPSSVSLEAVVISVEQFSSGRMASAGLKEQMAHFDKDLRSEKVAGRTCTFGTDGRQFAALGFVNGGMLVIVEGHTQKGIRPVALHGELVSVATKLPVK